ncbi:hypothetical protein NWI01_25030 [Nitrobacter winogradskyi]|uniref:Uncharacterized protein n=1 Tax=Nitrobacter winogradskyi TaxID=913 RepID=A0A4Y3WEN1_NITWI|nr:hypothetical protein NWI01_25030 [Nitrobacter winogradskyi]
MRNLHKDARSVPGARIGADRAAMFKVAENADRVGDDLMRLPALDVGDETDAAGIPFQRGVIEAFRRRSPGVFIGLFTGVFMACVLTCGFKRFRGRLRCR